MVQDTREKDQWISRVQRNWKYLSDAPEHLRADREVVLQAVGNNWAALELAMEPLRSDPEFNIDVLRQNGCALQFVTAPLKAHRQVVLAAVRDHWAALQYADASLQNDREIVVLAMEQRPIAIKYASEELQGQRDQLRLEAGYGTKAKAVNDPIEARKSKPKTKVNVEIEYGIRAAKERCGSSIYVQALSSPTKPKFAIPVVKGLPPSQDSLSSDSKWHSRRIEGIKERTTAMLETHTRLATLPLGTSAQNDTPYLHHGTPARYLSKVK
jgi:hypothetical protein